MGTIKRQHAHSGNPSLRAQRRRHFRNKDSSTHTFVTLFASAATTARADAQILGQLLAPSIAIPVVNAGPGAVFNGTFTLRRFIPTATGVAAVGTLAGVLTPVGGTPTAIFQNVVVPAAVTQALAITQAPAVAQAACPILHLDLGPLALDLLGLQVDLSEVVLDIGAQPGAGNLLGNLLCAVTGLLDSPGGLARLLNQLLGIL